MHPREHRLTEDARAQHVMNQVAHAGGAWGTALAMHASLRHDTVVYARETDVVEAINDPSIRENTTFLKVGIAFSSTACILPDDCSTWLSNRFDPRLRVLYGILSTRASLVTPCSTWRPV